MLMDNNAVKSVKTALSDTGKYETITSGISMYPMLRNGKDIVVIKTPDRPLKRHDVVLYIKEGTNKLILHRIIGFKGDALVIRGDNTYHREIVKRENVLGLLAAFYRKGKYCDCRRLSYRAYVVLMRLFYPVRYVFVVSRNVAHKILKRK